MSEDLLTEIDGHVFIITLNRTEKHNAFDDKLLLKIKMALDTAEHDKHIRAILLRANGQHFSAGADLGWMKRMANFTQAQNVKDAKVLADVLARLHHSKKPTIAVAQGSSFGGGAGLIAACDIAIAAENARFCFSEVKLGLIPAVISPYVIRAIGARNASWLFMSADLLDAPRALSLGLIQHSVPEEELACYGHQYARQIASLAPEAVGLAKQLVFDVEHLPIDKKVQRLTAKSIAQRRVSAEAQKGMHAFLNKKTPTWD